MTKNNSGGGRPTESAMLERAALTAPLESESDTGSFGSEEPAATSLGSDGSRAIESDRSELEDTEQSVPASDDTSALNESDLISPATTGSFLPENPDPSPRRQLVGQVIFGLVLGTVLFFLFGNGGDEVVDTNLSDAAATVQTSEASADDEAASNFGIGELEADGRSVLPQSDLPGVTTSTVDPSGQAPSTVVVERMSDEEVNGADIDGLAPTADSSGTNDDYQDDYNGAFDDEPNSPFTTEPASNQTTVSPPVPSELETYPSVPTTADEDPASTTTDTATDQDGEDDDSKEQTTTSIESTTVAASVEVSIVSVVDDGMSRLNLSALPDVGDYTYCWSVGYETSGSSSRFCVNEPNTVSADAPVLGQATAELEVYTFEGDLIGTDTATLALATQSVLTKPGTAEVVSSTGSLKVQSSSRPELTHYCWKVIQGELEMPECGDASSDRLDLDGQGFEAGPATVRGQVFVGPDGARQLVGSEEVQIELS